MKQSPGVGDRLEEPGLPHQLPICLAFDFLSFSCLAFTVKYIQTAGQLCTRTATTLCYSLLAYQPLITQLTYHIFRTTRALFHAAPPCFPALLPSTVLFSGRHSSGIQSWTLSSCTRVHPTARSRLLLEDNWSSRPPHPVHMAARATHGLGYHQNHSFASTSVPVMQHC